ncbi:hypothetical protein AO382_1413 [Moraxella catarrhalis]|uniref:Uncharacterized protein n=1 Tax=Moraxella catarrhalis TaxID=480 RepID=A0A7Z0UXT7_MORCA|nr:hypothetical protein AO382_1413 [Moraxella catarrhalis]
MAWLIPILWLVIPLTDGQRDLLNLQKVICNDNNIPQILAYF